MDDEQEKFADLQPQAQTTTNTQTEVKRDVQIDPKTETRFDDLPNLEDLLKSEKDIKTDLDSTPQGLQQVKQNEKPVDKIFTRKEDEKRAFVKHRVKLFTLVYSIVCVLLLGFVGFNTATLISKNKDIGSQTYTMQQGSTYLTNKEIGAPEDNVLDKYISLNAPRDYGDEERDLSFFDQITILFKALFG